MNDKKPTPVPAHLINPLAGYYIPARDNPPAPVRPGAEDHKERSSPWRIRERLCTGIGGINENPQRVRDHVRQVQRQRAG